MPESLPVGTTVLTEGLYRGRIDGAVALANSSAIFLVDAETVVEVEFSGLSSQDVVRVDPDSYFSNPFNRILRTSGRVDGFVLCATVLGKQGCLNGRTIP